LIPIRVEKPVFSPPVMTWVLIALNVAAFLWMRREGPERFELAIFEYSAIPQNVLGGDVTVLMYEGEPIAAVQEGSVVRTYSDAYDAERVQEQPTPSGSRYVYVRGSRDFVTLDAVRQKIPPWLTLLVAMFMHAGWLHLIGNMWFLHVFGSSVEDVLGKLAYVVFYLLAGLGASAAQLAHDPDSIVPFLGASGAIAGVMGAFAVRFAGAQVLTLVPIILYTLAHLPAWLFMVIYIGEQVFMSLMHARENGGVAWWAHIGGFAAGYLLVRVFPVSSAWKSVFSRRRPDPFS
jgi:membrane associated rhomboid family serine protease